MKTTVKLWLHSTALCWLLFISAVVEAEVAGAIELVDGSGKTLHLARPAQRIISLAPHLTELLFAAGAGDKIVATVAYSDYPPAALKIPRIGSNNALSYEAIVALSPDLVVAWQSGNGGELIARLEALGLKVYVDAPASLDDIASSVQALGQLVGSAGQAEQAAAQYRQKLAELRQRYSGRQSLSVFYQVWDDPLLTLNGQHVVSEIIALCGGRNVFADALALVPKLSVESLIAANPQLIVTSAAEAEQAQRLAVWRTWPMIAAVKNAQLYFVPPDLLQRHSLRILQGGEILCQHLEAARGL